MDRHSNENTLDLKRIIAEAWNYKWFYIIVIIIALGIWFLYMEFASQTFSVKSTIIIKTKSEQSYTSSSELLNVYDLLGQDIIMQNEVNILQSTPHIKELLDELGLTVSYYIQEDKLPRQFDFSLTDMYNQSPFMVILNSNHAQPLHTLFYVSIINDETFSLECKSDKIRLYNYESETYVNEIENVEFSGLYKFGENIDTNFFSFKVLLNANYNPLKFLNKDFFFKLNNLNYLAVAYQNSLLIESSGPLEGSIANLSFTGSNIQLSLDFLNGLIAKYIDKNLEEKTHLASTTIQYIDRQLANITDTLSRTEQELQNFRRVHNIMDVDEKSQRILNQREDLEDNRDEVSRRLNLLQQMKAYFDAAMEDASTLVVPSFLGIEDPLLNSLLQELIKLNSEREPMIQNNQLNNPRLAILNANIDNLLNSISENIIFRINSTNAELQDVNRRIAGINTEFTRLQQTQRRFLGIERQFNITQDVFTSLMEKRIQAQIARSSTRPDCVVIEPARFTGVASPNMKISLAMALFLAFMFPSIFVFGRKFFMDKIEDKEDLKRLCKLTQIGELPEYKKISGNVLVNEPTELLAESFRSLRSNINFFLNGERHKIILLTSSIPLEGKSMSSLNLATAFALAQYQTLLIRLDLRKAFEEDDEFSQQNLVGLSDYLIGGAKLEDIITRTEVPGLDVIPAGQIPPNPAELLSSQRIKDLLLLVKQRFDYVVIDTPPFGLVSDAFILMKYTDINVYIARLGKITKKTFLPNMEEIKDKKLENFYLLVNGIKPYKSAYARYATYPYGKSKPPRKKRKRKSASKQLNKAAL